MMKRMWLKTAACAALAMAIGSAAQGAGFEKAVLWSGKYAGRGGAAVADVDDAQALVFNPAGLVGAPGWSFTADVSPTWVKPSGPLFTANAPATTYEGKNAFLTPFGVFARYGVNDRLGLGLGVYVAGGTKALYEDVRFSDANPALNEMTGSAKSDLKIIETSLGAAYKLSNSLKAGLGYRVSFIQGAFSSLIVPDATKAFAVNVDDLGGKAFMGFRFGLMYQPEEAHWGLGLNVRTPIKSTLTGRTSGKIEAVAGPLSTPTDLVAGDATVKATLPTQVTLGGFWGLDQERLKLYLEYVWTNYSAVDIITVEGSFTIPSSATVPLSNFETHWMDMHQLRFATEIGYIENWAFRLGYVLTSQVVPNGYGRSTFSAPGFGHTFTVGTGTKIGKVGINLAFEYSKANGDATGNILSPPGAISDKAIAVHTGIAYNF